VAVVSKLSQKVAGLLDSGLAKHKAGDLVGASEEYDKVLKRSPTQPDALWLRGLVHLQSGASEAAVPMLEKAAKFRRNDPSILNDLGMALEASGDVPRSRTMFDKAIQIDPSHASALTNTARLLLADGDALAALEAADKAIEAQAFLVEAHNVRGSALHRLGKLAEARAAYAAALALEPANAEVLLNKGILLHELGDLDEAQVTLERVLGVASRGSAYWADATMTLGLIESDQGRFAEAIDIYSQVIELSASHVSSYVNRGSAQENIGHVEAAADDYAAALEIDPQCTEASYYLGRVKLLQGQWEEGWSGYESRWDVSSYVSQRRDRDLPQWDGSQPPAQKKVLVWGEQGLGDQILFANMLPEIVEKGVEVVAEFDPRLVPLLPRLSRLMPVYGYDTVPSDVIAACASQMPLASLGKLCRLVPEDFPEPTRYLDVDEGLVEQFKKKYQALARGRLKIGIAWHSINPSFGEAKSLPLNHWAPILKARDSFFVSVQYGEPRQEIADVEKATGVEIHVDDDFDPFVNFSHTAAQIASLDLVIATSGTAVHLAGALGKETWVMVPHVPEWRWGLSGNNSIWYPDVRIFRQDRPRQWTKVVSDVAEALAAKT
jgi:tetratricopeptide (TPR) repeat protein